MLVPSYFQHAQKHACTWTTVSHTGKTKFSYSIKTLPNFSKNFSLPNIILPRKRKHCHQNPSHWFQGDVIDKAFQCHKIKSFTDIQFVDNTLIFWKADPWFLWFRILMISHTCSDMIGKLYTLAGEKEYIAW